MPSNQALRASTLPHLDFVLSRYAALEPLRTQICQSVEAVCTAHRSGNGVLVCGNGGSAADAEHIVGELVKQFKLPRALAPQDSARFDAIDPQLSGQLQRGVRAFSLVSQTSLLTAVANDTDASMIFAQQVFVYGKSGDVLIGISTSGNSRNVVRALQVGKAMGLFTIGLTGAQPCKMDTLCDLILKAPATETFEIQELHLPIYHTLCLMVEEELFGETA